MTITLNYKVPAGGTVALVGSGEYLPPMCPVDEWLLRQLNEPPRVVCLPTAAGTEGADRIRYWKQLGAEHFAALGVSQVESLDIIDRNSAQSQALADQVDAANFIYFSGGKPWYLYDCLVDTPVWAAVVRVLARGGVVAGCSAGAMIFGEYIPGRESPLSLNPGFGLLRDAIVMPHFDELPPLIQTMMTFLTRDKIVAGVEKNTALVLQGDAWRVIGTGSVWLMTGSEKVRYAESDFPK